MAGEDKSDQLSKLLAASKGCVVEGLLNSLSGQNTISKEILCVLLDYTIEEPFPPVFGFGQRAEVFRYLDDGEHPLSHYNSPDFEYFSENKNPEIKFSKHAKDIFRKTNRCLLKNYSYEVYKVYIFDAYVDICKTLNASHELSSLLPVHNDFHVIASDFDEVNHWAIMQKALPKKILNKIKKAIAAYEEKPALSLEEQALFAETVTTLDLKRADYNGLVTALGSKEIQRLYSADLLFYIEPFRYEIEHKELNAYVEISDHPKLTVTAMGNDYYCYFLEAGQVHAIKHYSAGVLETETYYVYSKTQVEAYTFVVDEGVPCLDEYNILVLKGHSPSTYKSIAESRINEVVYTLNSSGHVTESTVNENYFFEADIYDRPTRLNHDRTEYRRYTYNVSGELVRISECYGGNRRVGDIAYNDSDATIIYSVDYSFIDEAMLAMVQVSHDHILPILAKKNIGLIKAFVLERNRRLSFPIWHVYSLTEKNQRVRWSKFDVHDGSSEREMIYLNFVGYVLSDYSNSVESLSDDQGQGYLEKAYELLADKLSVSLKRDFQADIPIYVKSEHEDKTRINNLVING